MKVKCIDAAPRRMEESLTLGEIYEVEEVTTDNTMYQVVYFVGARYRPLVSKDRFEVIPEAPPLKTYDIPVMVRVTATSREEACEQLQAWMADPRDGSNLPHYVNNLSHPDYDKDNSGQLLFYSGAFEWKDGSIHDEEEPAPPNSEGRLT